MDNIFKGSGNTALANKCWRWSLWLTLLALTLLIVTSAHATPPISGNTIEFADSGQSLTGSGSGDIALGDLDGDGDADAFVAVINTGNEVWMNNGSGLFTNSGQSLGNSASYYVDLGDVDQDGDLDAIVANESSQANKVWLNNGSGVFTDSGQTIGSSRSKDIYLGDLDNDGDLDAFVVNTGSQPDKVYLNDGSGTFTDSGQTLGTTASDSVDLGDLDGDGDLDAYVGNFPNQANKIWFNDGSGTFTDSGQSLGAASTRDAVLGDVDGDGDLDAFDANESQADKVWLNNGNGVFTDSGQNLGSGGGQGVALTDLDNDGDLDAFIAIATGADNIWQNDGNGSFTQVAISLTTASGSGIGVADLDNDGDIDAMTTGYGGVKKVWRNDAVHRNAPFHSGVDITTSADGAVSVYAADMDNDGDLDILSASQGGDTFTWHENDGAANPSFTSFDIATSVDGATSDGAISIKAADMDNDGDLDIVSAAYYGNTIAWFENDGAADPTFTARDIAASAAAAYEVFVADMDNDGDLDILSASHIDDTIAWYENDGAADPSFTPFDIATSADSAQSVFAADMDNDGDLDILSASRFDDTIAWYENDGAADPSFTPSDIVSSANATTSADGAREVFAADMDNDGDLDILSASEVDDTIAWYENDGAADPSFTPFDIVSSANATTSADGAKSVFAADIDNDGDLDILSASEDDATIAWYENDGAADPSFTASDIATSANGAWSVFAADMDNDGDLDILSASRFDDTIAWYENEGGSAGFTVTDTSVSSPVFIPNSTEDDVMRVAFTHNGIAADRTLELARFDLDFFRGDCSTPLSDAEADAFLDEIRIRLDDGDDTFETDGSDVLVTSISSFSMTGGVQSITFTNDDANAQVTGTNSKTYWISALATATASSANPRNFCLNFDPDADALVEGKTPDFAVSIQDSTATNTGNVPTAVSLQNISSSTNNSILIVLAMMMAGMATAVLLICRKQA